MEFPSHQMLMAVISLYLTLSFDMVLRITFLRLYFCEPQEAEYYYWAFVFKELIHTYEKWRRPPEAFS